jgi:hypothetical protein
MRHTHIESGGRYPVLRTLAILYLVGAAVVLVYGIWRAASVLIYGQTTDNFFGEPAGWAGRISVAASYLAVSFFTVLFMVAFAELIKLFVDIERNTRMSAMAVAAAAPASMEPASSTAPGDGRTGGRLPWIEGEETAEGALLRGH